MVEEQVLAQTQDLTIAGCRVEVVCDLDRFNALAPEWDRLVESCGVDHAFLSHAWFRTWWESFGADNELFVVTVRDRGELAAAAPMMKTRASMYGVKLNAIHAIYNPHTPRYDFVVGRNRNPLFYSAIWSKLLECGQADAIILTQIPENSPTIGTMERLGRQSGWLTGCWSSGAAPYIPLNDGYEAFFAKLKSGAQYNLVKRYTRLQRKGPVELEIVSGRDEVLSALEDGFRIEAAAWKGMEGTAILSDPAVTEFYTRLAVREAELGSLHLAFLRFNGKRIAFNYLLRSANRLYGIKIGYDPEYHMYSPGNMLLNLILRQACMEGVEQYDFLGTDDDWKFEWTSHKREHCWLFLLRDRLALRLLHYLKFSVLPALKPAIRGVVPSNRTETP